jgi:hypothetical protein
MPAPWSAQDALRATQEDPTLLAYAAEPMEPDLYDIMPPAIGGLFIAPVLPGDLIARLTAALAVPPVAGTVPPFRPPGTPAPQPASLCAALSTLPPQPATAIESSLPIAERWLPPLARHVWEGWERSGREGGQPPTTPRDQILLTPAPKSSSSSSSSSSNSRAGSRVSSRVGTRASVIASSAATPSSGGGKGASAWEAAREGEGGGGGGLDAFAAPPTATGLTAFRRRMRAINFLLHASALPTKAVWSERTIGIARCCLDRCLDPASRRAERWHPATSPLLETALGSRAGVRLLAAACGFLAQKVEGNQNTHGAVTLRDWAGLAVPPAALFPTEEAVRAHIIRLESAVLACCGWRLHAPQATCFMPMLLAAAGALQPGPPCAPPYPDPAPVLARYLLLAVDHFCPTPSSLAVHAAGGALLLALWATREGGVQGAAEGGGASAGAGAGAGSAAAPQWGSSALAELLGGGRECSRAVLEGAAHCLAAHQSLERLSELMAERQLGVAHTPWLWKRLRTAAQWGAELHGLQCSAGSEGVQGAWRALSALPDMLQVD